MDNHRMFRSLLIGSIAVVIPLSGSQCALAVEILPAVTILSPQQKTIDPNPAAQLLTEEDLTIAHERSIADVLQGSPGLSFTRAGGYGQQSAVLMRGVGGQGLFTFDDMPLLLSLPGLQNLDTLPSEALGSVEIERGPGKIYRPFQAMGGAVRLYSSDTDENKARLSVETGSFGILRETVAGGASNAWGRMRVTLSRGDAFDGSHLAVADNNPEREPFRFTQGIMRFASEVNSRLLWQGSMLYRKSWLGSDTVGADENFRAAFKDDSHSFGEGETWLAQNSLNAKLTPHWSSRMQLGFTQLHNTIVTGPFQSGMTNRIYLASLRHQHTLIDDGERKTNWRLTWGGQVQHEQAESQPVLFDEERTLSAAYWGTDAQYRNVGAELGVRVEHFDRYGDQPLFKTAGTLQMTPQLKLTASGGTGYRIPSYTELLSLFFGNINLRPERSATGELRLAWSPSKTLQMSVNGYYNRYDDLIAQVYDPYKGPASINVQDAEVSGVELDAQYAGASGLATGVSYTYNDSRDLITDRLLPLRPPHTARVWGQKKLPGLPVKLWTEIVIRSATWNDAANTLPVNEAVQLNAAIRYAVTKPFELYLRGENLTNNVSPQFYSADMPGTTVYGGFQLAL